MFYLFATGTTGGIMCYLAWGYVAIRVIHSLVQVTSNKVLARFGLFALGSIVLIIMALMAAAKLF